MESSDDRKEKETNKNISHEPISNENKEHEHHDHQNHDHENHEHHEYVQHHELHHEIKTHRKFSAKKTTIIITSALLLILIINIILLINIQSVYNNNFPGNTNPTQNQNPASISLTVINYSDCKDCFNVNYYLSQIEQNNVKVKSLKTLDYNSPDAKSLISKYSITKIPTIIVTGEIDKTGNMNLSSKGDALILDQMTPIYFDLSLNREVGKVSTISIKDDSCKNCTDIGALETQLLQEGVIITDQKTVYINDSDSQALLSKYNIKIVPALIISSDLSYYPFMSQINWSQVGSIESDGSYVTRTIPPPYKDLTTGQVKGLINLTYLSDSSCATCYNVSLHKQTLTRLNVFINSENTVDISSTEGKFLIAKYNITKVPTILMSSDANEYLILKQAWSQVGSIESDGTFIFRNLDLLNVNYKDLTTNKIVSNGTSTV